MLLRLAFVSLLITLLLSLCQAAPLADGARKTTDTSISASPSAKSSASSSTSTPLTTASQNNMTSTPVLSSVTNFAAFANDTIGAAINQLLLNLGPDAPGRWVTADGISSTMIGSDDPVNSNRDLSEQVDVAFSSNHAGWVDTYIDFLIEAGEANVNLTSAQVDEKGQKLINATAAFAALQVKVVNAYEASHPGNVSASIGVNVANISRVDMMTMVDVMSWASYVGKVNCTSSGSGNGTLEHLTVRATECDLIECDQDKIAGFHNCPSSDAPYTEEDYNAYMAAANTTLELQLEMATLDNALQMAVTGYVLKQTIPQFGIFNLSMSTGGSGLSTQFSPAWTATITWSMIKRGVVLSPSGIVQDNLGHNLANSTRNDTENLFGIMRRDSIDRRVPTTQRFSPLQAIASSMDPPPQKPVPAVAVHAAASHPSGGLLNQTLGDGGSISLLDVREGSWAADRDMFIKYARDYTPDIVDRYFGPGQTGSGPIGRTWTHVALLITASLVNGTTEIGDVQVLGKVFDTLPILK